MRPFNPQLSLRLRFAGWGQLFLFAAVLWLSVYLHAHKRLHAGHSEAEVQCAVTLLAHGEADLTASRL